MQQPDYRVADLAPCAARAGYLQGKSRVRRGRGRYHCLEPSAV